MTSGTVAVVGAGIVGRLLALRLARRGVPVTLFDRGDWTSRAACSFAAAGLLAPVAEAAAAGEGELCGMGLASLGLWPEVAASLVRPVTLRRSGSLCVARDVDLGDVTDLRERIVRHLPNARVETLDGAGIARLEPALAGAGFGGGLYLTDEGAVHAPEAMAALAATLEAEPRVTLRLGTEVAAVEPGCVRVGAQRCAFTVVADCRGLGARGDLGELRGVRGEVVELYAPEVTITRPVRVLHTRYPIYVVPRGPHTYAVGATCLESESMAPVTVKAALELLGAAYGVHPGFHYAQVTALIANCRPAFPDHLPRVVAEGNLVRVNGLYRHGFLLGPLISQQAAQLIEAQL